MAFDGTEGSVIDTAKAGNWTGNYRTSNPGEPRGHFFGKDILNDILSQSGCMGIRIYYAEDGSGDKKLILVGADAEQNDMLGSRDTVADFGMTDPPYNSATNVLNS